MGIEPTYPAWEAGVLPMNYIRDYSANIAQFSGKGKREIRNSVLKNNGTFRLNLRIAFRAKIR